MSETKKLIAVMDTWLFGKFYHWSDYAYNMVDNDSAVISEIHTGTANDCEHGCAETIKNNGKKVKRSPRLRFKRVR